MLELKDHQQIGWPNLEKVITVSFSAKSALTFTSYDQNILMA